MLTDATGAGGAVPSPQPMPKAISPAAIPRAMRRPREGWRIMMGSHARTTRVRKCRPLRRSERPQDGDDAVCDDVADLLRVVHRVAHMKAGVSPRRSVIIGRHPCDVDHVDSLRLELRANCRVECRHRRTLTRLPRWQGRHNDVIRGYPARNPQIDHPLEIHDGRRGGYSGAEVVCAHRDVQEIGRAWSERLDASDWPCRIIFARRLTPAPRIGDPERFTFEPRHSVDDLTRVGTEQDRAARARCCATNAVVDHNDRLRPAGTPPALDFTRQLERAIRLIWPEFLGRSV